MTDSIERLEPPTTGRKPRRYIGAGIAALSLTTGCLELNQPLVETPEAIERQELVVCWVEKPNCTRADVATGDAMGVIGVGNAIAIDEMPEMCGEEYDVEPTLEKDVPPWVLYALLSVEDNDFCEHDGVDYKALFRAALANLDGDTQGASTVDMQTVRLLMPELKQKSDIARKIEEIIALAPELNEKYTKSEIAALYLNNYYFGRGAYGIEAGALAHFGVSAKDLTVDQGAAMIAMLQNPGKYQGSLDDPAEAQQAYLNLYYERNEVLESMAEKGYFDAEALKDWQGQELGQIPYNSFGVSTDFSPARSINAEFAAMQIVNDIREKLPEDTSIFELKTINTTISKHDQAALAEAYARHTAAQPDDGRQFGALLVDETGAITAYIPGEYDPEGPNIDLLRAHVMGGSRDKLWPTTAAMLVNGVTPDTMIVDPCGFEWLNYDGNGSNYRPDENNTHCLEQGQRTLREAVGDYSTNWGLLTRIKEQEAQGIPTLDNTFRIMDEFGVERLKPVGPAIVTSAEIRPIDRALGAMQLLGLEGRAIPEKNRGRMYNSAVLRDGTHISVYDEGLPYQQVIPPEIAAYARDIARTSVEIGTSSALNQVPPEEVYAKTGTPENNVAPGINGYAEINGKKRGFAVLLRYPDGLRSLGSDADGGSYPARLAADAITNLANN